MFLDGKEYDIEIAEEDTLGDVINKINEATEGKIQASVDDAGNFSIKAFKEVDGEMVVDNGASLILGSAGDTSNLASALKLHSKTEGGYTSSYPVSAVNTTKAMTGLESGLSGIKFYDSEGNEAESGKIIINGEVFGAADDLSEV
jgi:hypothetical protein